LLSYLYGLENMGGGGVITIWRWLAGKSAFCLKIGVPAAKLQVGVFAVVADCLKTGVLAAKLLMGIILSQRKKKVNRVSGGEKQSCFSL
jgi:hypothetical protein